jgi:hypothetical protein
MKRCARKSGWVLIETLVALTVLSIGMLAVNRALSQGLLLRANARDYTTARFLGEAKINDLLLQPILVEGANGSGGFGEVHPQFSYKWTVSRVTLPRPKLPQGLPIDARLMTPPVEFIGKVRLVVSWTRRGSEHETTFETMIGPDRLYTPKAEEEEPRAVRERR